MKKFLRLAHAVLAGSALWMALTPVAASASTAIEREFRYGPGRFTLTRNADGTTQVEMSAATRDYTPGHLDLPLVGERVELPPGLRLATVEVIELETAALAQGVRLPSAMLMRPGVDSVERSVPDPAIFGHAGFVPEPLVRVGAQGFQRGQGVAYVTVSPVRWNAATGELERVQRVRVRLVLEATSERPLQRERVVPEWEDAGAGAAAPGSRVAQPTTLVGGVRQAEPFKATQLPSLQGSPVAYVIVTNDAMAPAFQQLADWKTQSGVPAVVRTMSFIKQQYPAGADDAERVRLFLRDAYARWGTKWALLGGDTDVIPARIAHTTYYGGEDIATDLYYSCLDGNWNADGDGIYGEAPIFPPGPSDSADMMPELYVGRAPASTLAEAQLLVNKTLKYQREPVADYMNSILSFAEVLFPQQWSPGMSTQLDGAELVDYDLLPILDTVPWIHSGRLYENYTDARWRAGALRETRAVVIDSLDRGYNIALHVGHGYSNVMSVGDNNLSTSDAAGLTNGDRLMNLYAINCNSASIDDPCIAEAFMKAPGGGAVTVIGCTRFDFPTYGRQYKSEYFSLLYQQGVTAIGETQARQKLPFVSISDYDGVHRWMEMALILLGDPELHIYTATPRTLSVVHPATMPLGDSTLTVNVAVGGVPLDSARVTVYRAEHEYVSALTNAAGNVTLAVRPDTLGAMDLTVTGFNCRPYRASISLVTGSYAALAVRGVRIDDSGAGGTSGNGNGVWDVGETVALSPLLRNNGGGSAASLSGSLRTADGLVTILQPAANYGTIAAGDSARPSAGLLVRIPATAADQREVPFELRLADGAGRTYVERFQLTVRAPELLHLAHVVVDAGGNNDGRPDPGETVNYSVRLRNLGSGVARNVSARLRSLDGLAVVTDSVAAWGDVPSGEERTGDAFTFIPTSSAATFMLVISDQYGERLRQTLDLLYPSTPTGLLATGASGSISVTWGVVPEADLMGYNVYRASASAGPFVKVTPVPVDHTAYFHDAGLLQLTRYYHKVSSVDRSGNESALSTAVSTSTNPPMHPLFPFQTRRLTPAPVLVDHIYGTYAMDIVTGSDVLYVWHADGSSPVDADGSGGTPGDFTTRGTYFAGGPTVADLDGGTKEIIGSTMDSTYVYVFDLEGRSKPGWPVKLGDAMYSAVAVADLQGDGQKELVVASNGYDLYALRANGTELMDGDSNPATLGVFKHLGAMYNYGTPALAPLQNDGTNAIVFGSADTYLYAWRYDGSNLPGFPVKLAAAVRCAPAVGSLDGPAGPLSIVLTATCDSLYAFRADGSRRTGFPVHCPMGSTYGKHPSPALADMNGDGYLDIVQASTDGRLYVFDRNGAVLPLWNNVRYSTLTASASECSPVVADINGDGHPDVVTGDANGELSAFSGADANVLPGFPIQLGGELVGTPALCDCDGDGKTEIVANGLDFNVYMWDYDFPFSPGQIPPWPQFSHDAARTGYAGTNITADAGPVAAAAPRALELALPAPNPARGGTRLWYGVPADRAGDALELAIYDLSGRRVRTLQSGRAEPGRHSVAWDLRDASGAMAHAGVYFARLSLGAEARSQKLVVIP